MSLQRGKEKTCTTRVCNYFQDPGVQLQYAWDNTLRCCQLKCTVTPASLITAGCCQSGANSDLLASLSFRCFCHVCVSALTEPGQRVNRNRRLL